jgi:hypothetical protein
MKPENFYTGFRKSTEAHLPTVTVGINDGMFRGSDHFAIQAAVDHAARQGGGTVQILSGRYILRNAIFLPSFVTLTGCGDETILEKHASKTVALAEDCDWYSWSVAVEDASGFAVGDGIMLSSRRIDEGKSLQVAMHTITGIEGNRLFLDRIARMNHWLEFDAKVTSLHSLIDAQKVQNIAIKNLCLVGNRDANERLDGNYGAAIFMQEGENVDIQNVTIENFNGDGVSWQIVHDVRVENCVITNMASLGLHPGSGSRRPVMRGDKISDCKIGIFWCWGVTHGIAEDNDIDHCNVAISTGHRDNDNIIRNNRISNSTESAIYFRPERSAAHTSNRVLVEENIIECSGDVNGISVARGAEDTIIRRNKIDAAKAIVIDDEAVRTVVEENEVG